MDDAQDRTRTVEYLAQALWIAAGNGIDQVWDQMYDRTCKRTIAGMLWVRTRTGIQRPCGTVLRELIVNVIRQAMNERTTRRRI